MRRKVDIKAAILRMKTRYSISVQGKYTESQICRHRVYTENNEAVVYKSVDDKNNHIIMTERKFSVKSQDKLKVEIDNSAFRRLNYRTADNPPIHLTLFFAMQVMCVYF